MDWFDILVQLMKMLKNWSKIYYKKTLYKDLVSRIFINLHLFKDVFLKYKHVNKLNNIIELKILISPKSSFSVDQNSI